MEDIEKDFDTGISVESNNFSVSPDSLKLDLSTNINMYLKF